MEENAAFHGFANHRRGPAVLASIVAAALLVASLAGTAAARAPIGKDGQIHACYRVKGKPKGALRVVPSAHARCRRGERKATWSVASSSGSASATGGGSQGAAGQNGANGSPGSEDAALKAQVGALTLKVQALEGVLQGLNNEGLTSAVNSLAATEALCEQSEALTEQVNLVAGVVEGLGLNGVLTGLGGLLVVPTLPTALAPFNCPTS